MSIVTCTSTRILVLTTFDDDVSVFEAISAGAIGYLLKDTSRAGLVEAVRSAARGDSPIAPRVASKLVARIARMPIGRRHHGGRQRA